MACYLLKRLRSKKKKKKKGHCFERVLDETATATEMGTCWNKRFQEETLLFTCIFKLSSFAGSPLQNLGQGEINKIFAVFEWEPRQRIIHFYNWNPKLLAHIVFNLKSGAVKDDKNIQPFANYLRKVQIHSSNRSFPRCCCRPYFFVDPHIPTELICSAVFRKDDQFRVWLNTSFKVCRFVLMYHARIKDLKSLLNVKLCHQRPLVYSFFKRDINKEMKGRLYFVTSTKPDMFQPFHRNYLKTVEVVLFTLIIGRKPQKTVITSFQERKWGSWL